MKDNDARLEIDRLKSDLRGLKEDVEYLEKRKRKDVESLAKTLGYRRGFKPSCFGLDYVNSEPDWVKLVTCPKCKRSK